MVDTTAGHEHLNFMDAYSDYNLIFMYLPDKKHDLFITDRDLYCYKMMSFGLKNTEATYQKLVNSMFAQQIRKIVESYIDTMLVKSIKAEDHIRHICLQSFKNTK